MQKGTKNRFMAALIATVISISVMAQAPQKMSFQSIIRNSSGALVINQPVGLRISVLQGSATGVAVYSETQTDSTNANGLVSLQIGGGKVVTGSFTAINWATGTYFIKTDIDPTGGNNYTVSGTSQLLSVAYALYAQNAGIPGVKGDSGVSVRSSKVIGDSLFVTLTTGQTINTGNVRGAQGVQGIQGLTGSTGLTGAQGIQGLTGNTGAQGQQGLTGNKGDSGVSVRSSKVVGDSLFVTLSTGQLINTGNVRGAQGAQGVQGVQGVQGLIGSTGLTGAQGIQGLTGATGAQGIQGLTGNTGAQGQQGLTGNKGDSGVSVRSSKVVGDSLFVTLSTGKTYTAGNVRGTQGIQGIQGLTGATGAQGIQGLTGAQGLQGIQGIQGATGVSITNTRVLGDSLYIVLSNGQFLTAGYVRGAQGLQGIQGNKGDSGVSVRYSKVIGDSLFVTLSTGQTINTGNVRGVQGIQGLTGATGSQGIQGLTGQTGAKGDSGISVRSSKVIGDSLFVTLSTGQIINAGNVRGLTGATGLLNSAASAGVTPYWNGTAWILNGTNVYNNGSNIGIGTATPNSSAALEVKDTAKGLLMPRMTMKQRLAIATPATGLMVYQTDSTKGFWYYDGTVWATNYKSTAVDSIITAQPKGTKIGFAASTTWTCPAGVTQITVELWGGAGAGSPSLNWNFYNCNPQSSSYGGNGGNGGYNKATISVKAGNSYTITIGTGGGSASDNNGQYIIFVNGGCGTNYSQSGGATSAYYTSGYGNGKASSFNGIFAADGGQVGGPATQQGNSHGAVGANGAVINYNYPQYNYGTRSYIPSSLLNPYPISYSQGGAGGAAGVAVYAGLGNAGEDGYCVISY